MEFFGIWIKFINETNECLVELIEKRIQGLCLTLTEIFLYLEVCFSSNFFQVIGSKLSNILTDCPCLEVSMQKGFKIYCVSGTKERNEVLRRVSSSDGVDCHRLLEDDLGAAVQSDHHVD